MGVVLKDPMLTMCVWPANFLIFQLHIMGLDFSRFLKALTRNPHNFEHVQNWTTLVRIPEIYATSHEVPVHATRLFHAMNGFFKHLEKSFEVVS